MRYDRWAPFYEEIRSDFGFPFDREERSAARLESLLPPEFRVDPLGRIAARLRGRPAIVVGGAPNAGPPPVWRLPSAVVRPSIVAADAAVGACVSAGLVPEVVATDLDGPLPAQISANHRGALVLVHAHGDNLEQLERWVPQFPGELAGSWAGPPRAALLNVGGFTDGDRAAFLADAAGATRILLWGFDFERVEEAEPESAARKLRKLRWAERLLAELQNSGSCPIELWQRDGTLVPFRRVVREAPSD